MLLTDPARGHIIVKLKLNSSLGPEILYPAFNATPLGPEYDASPNLFSYT